MKTPSSLLQRLRGPTEPEAWERFVELYTPLLYAWARSRGLQEHDVADLVQDVFTILVQKLPEFQYDQHRSFRAWLRTVTLNRWRDTCKRRAPRLLAGDNALLTEQPDDGEAFWEAEYRRRLVGQALELMQAEFEPTTWRACWAFVVCDRSATEVARELGISENAVYIAKHRVLRRLRQELEGLLD
jgi:RNA polymerase sigma-70 factor (ECF subfamily)